MWIEAIQGKLEDLEAAENPPIGEVSAIERAVRLAIDIKEKVKTVKSRLDVVKASAEAIYGAEPTSE